MNITRNLFHNKTEQKEIKEEKIKQDEITPHLFIENVIKADKNKIIKTSKIQTYFRDSLKDSDFVQNIIDIVKEEHYNQELNQVKVACALAAEGVDSTLLRELLQKNSGPFNFIRKFKITDKKVLIEIAKIATENRDFLETERHKSYYDIPYFIRYIISSFVTDEKKEGNIFDFISEFGMKDKEIEEIVKYGAQHNGKTIGWHIEKYGIKDENTLIEILKIMATDPTNRNGAAIMWKYELKNEEAKKSIAELHAKHNPKNFCEYIKNYEFTDEKIVIELLKIAAEHGGISINFSKSGIKDEKILTEIVEIALNHTAPRSPQDSDSTYICQFLNEIGIKDENTVIRLLEKCATIDGENVSANIHLYRIKDQESLIRIAKKAVAQNPAGAEERLKNYDIKDTETLETIRKSTLFSRLSNFLDTVMKNKSLIKMLISSYGKDIQPYAKLLQAEPENIRLVCEKIFADKDEEFKKSSLELVDHLINKIEKVINNKSGKQKDLIKNELYDLLKYQISLYSLRDKAPTSFTLKTWESVFDCHDPRMRYRLVSEIASMDDTQNQVYSEIIKGKSTQDDYIVLPAIFLSKLIKNPEKWKDLVPKMQSRDPFKDFTYQRPLLNTLKILNESSELSEDDVISLLNTSIYPKDKSKTLSNLLAIQSIISLKGIKELKIENFEKNNKDFNKIYMRLFKQHIPIGSMGGFAQKFSDTFTSYRANDLLFVYAGTLGKDNESDKALSTFATYVESVLKGKFKQRRYSNSDHLDTVFKNREDLKKSWIAGSSKTLEIDKKSKQNDDEFFKEKIIQNKHLDLSKYSHLKAYLTELDEDKTSIVNQLEKAISESQEKLKKSQEELKTSKDKGKINEALKEEGTILKKFQLQNEIIKMITAKDPSKEEQLKNLQKIDKILNDIDKECKLVEDIDARIKSFKVKPPKEMTIVDTDDPWDLFLCGTEVEGSCQSVDGEPYYCRGLLGYLLDGKTRLIAIKNPEGRIIARRILRILLEDGKKPVLMMESMYSSNTATKEQKEELDQFVKQRAKDLGLPLYEEGEKPVKIESISSESPWEYVDSANGLQFKGVYTIQKASLVQAA